MEIQNLFGLPAHPLVVHAAVVLLPLAAVGTIVCALVPNLRRSYAVLALAFALAATVAVYVAQGSGEELEEKVHESELVEEHAEQAESVLPWAIGVTVAAAAVVAAPGFARRRPNIPARNVTAALAAAALVTGLGATYTVMKVGHSGAKATWEEVQSGRERAEGGERGEFGERGEGDGEFEGAGR